MGPGHARCDTCVDKNAHAMQSRQSTAARCLWQEADPSDPPPAWHRACLGIPAAQADAPGQHPHLRCSALVDFGRQAVPRCTAQLRDAAAAKQQHTQQSRTEPVRRCAAAVALLGSWLAPTSWRSPACSGASPDEDVSR